MVARERLSIQICDTYLAKIPSTDSFNSCKNCALAGEKLLAFMKEKFLKISIKKAALSSLYSRGLSLLKLYILEFKLPKFLNISFQWLIF